MSSEGQKTWKPDWRAILIAFVSFLIGILVFFPKSDLLSRILQSGQPSGWSVRADEPRIGWLGGLSVSKLELIRDSESPASLRLYGIEGSVSVYDLLLGDRLRTELNWNGIEYTHSLVSVKAGRYNLKADMADYTAKNSSGSLDLTAESLVVAYNDEVPVIGEKLALIVSNIKAQVRIENSMIRIRSASINADLADAEITGIWPLGNGEVDANVRLKIKPAAFRKIEGLADLLRLAGVLQGEDTVELKISGYSSKPQFIPVKVSGRQEQIK